MFFCECFLPESILLLIYFSLSSFSSVFDRFALSSGCGVILAFERSGLFAVPVYDISSIDLYVFAISTSTRLAISSLTDCRSMLISYFEKFFTKSLICLPLSRPESFFSESRSRSIYYFVKFFV